jgi:hypothetical protein
LIITVGDPMTITSGGPTQIAMSVTRAASIPPMITLGEHGPLIGPPTWGIGGKPGVTIGQTCMSVNLAAGGINNSSSSCTFRDDPIDWLALTIRAYHELES